MTRRAKMNVHVGLPGVFSVEIQDISTFFTRSKPEEPVLGPYLIIDRNSGQALQTTWQAANGARPFLAAVTGRREQQWGFKVVPDSESEVLILSVVNGHALDVTMLDEDGAPLTLWEEHGAAWQRWRATSAPDGIATYLRTAHYDRSLDVGPDTAEGCEPWLWEHHGAVHQQFLVVPVRSGPGRV
jgi:hypothetical protein